jgi:malonyl-CoA O-methyltransferase
MTEHPPTEHAGAGPGDVARAYDRWAAQYDDDRNTTRDLDAAVVRRAPLRLAGRDVLELGCGTGKNTVWLANEARQVHAFDFSDGMLAAARRRVQAPNVRFVQQDVRMAWPLAAASVDVVVGNLVLEHVRDLAPIHAEAARVLRPGGQLFLCELHPFRQLRGGQAHFVDPVSGETVHVPAFTHSTSEYVNGGLAAGLVLRELGEWLEPGAPAEMPPRLLALLFERP